MKFSTLTSLSSILALSQQCSAFTTSCPQHHTLTALCASTNTSDDRRTFFKNMIFPVATAAISTAINPSAAFALLADPKSGDAALKAGKTVGIVEAKKRFTLAIKDIDELLDNYAEISTSGGDNVRLYLGTVGTKSHMYGITKILKELREEADDVIDFTETANEVEAYLFQAEGAAYQSLFVGGSSAKGTPESLLATAKKDVISMRKLMGDLAIQLNLDV